MIGIFSYTVIATYLALCCGMTGIVLAANGQVHAAVILLMVAGLFDAIDGSIAKTKKNRSEFEKKFGIQIDSLSDVICFGVLPAFIGYAIGLDKVYFIIGLVVFVACAMTRLAYYNVTEEIRQEATTAKRTSYEGLPVTNSSLIFSFLFSISSLFGKTVFQYIYFAFILIVAFLFVFKKFKMFKAGKKGMSIVIAFGVLWLVWMIYNASTLIDLWNF